MANYEYIARNAAGEETAGSMQAENEIAVIRTLDERKLFPVRVAEQSVKPRGLGGRKVRGRDVGVAYGQLADLLRSGVPMLRALDVLVRATPNAALSGLLAKVRGDVAAGKTLADAMAAHPKVFAHLHSAMVRAGERAGFLEDVLANLCTFLERQDELQSKVRGALVYPMLLTGLGVVAVTVILVALVPKFKPMFQNMSLPLPTQVLFALSGVLVHYWLLVAGMGVVAVLAVRSFLRSESGRRMWEKWRLKLPFVGRAVRMVSITRFCRILGTLLANGVPILQALAISKDATGSELLAGDIGRAAESVRAGEPLAEPLKRGGFFPLEIIEMIAVAEESNQLEKVLLQIADTVERHTNRRVDEAVRMIEPLVLMIIASAIGFVAVGLLYPIFTMSQTLK